MYTAYRIRELRAYNNIGGTLNLAVFWPTANPPNLMYRQYFCVYGICHAELFFCHMKLVAGSLSFYFYAKNKPTREKYMYLPALGEQISKGP